MHVAVSTKGKSFPCYRRMNKRAHARFGCGRLTQGVSQAELFFSKKTYLLVRMFELECALRLRKHFCTTPKPQRGTRGQHANSHLDFSVSHQPQAVTRAAEISRHGCDKAHPAQEIAATMPPDATGSPPLCCIVFTIDITAQLKVRWGPTRHFRCFESTLHFSKAHKTLIPFVPTAVAYKTTNMW